MRKKQQKKNMSERTRLDGYLDIFALGVLAATLFGFLGRFWWIFDLFSHFRVQYMQIGLVLIGLALWRRRNKQAVALALLAGLNYAFVLPFYFGQPAVSDAKPVRALLMNLNASNGHTQEVLDAVKAADPDLLLLEEVTPKWLRELEPLNDDFPYRIAEPRDDCFGILLLSKHPLKNGQVVEIGSAEVPSILAEIYLPQGEISFIGTHPLPPVGAEYARDRDNQLKELSKYARSQNHPVLLVGDLNTSPWSPHFRDLLAESGLKNSMDGFGFQPTWPAGNPLLRIPLDHALHAPEIAIHTRAVGKSIGSDHLPLILDFSILEK